MAITFQAPATPPKEVKGRSLWQDSLRRLFQNKAAVTSIVLLVLITLICIIGPYLSPHPFDELYWDSVFAPPNATHWFGTDATGRDLMVRTFYGGRVSMMVGVIATFVALMIGVIYGATAGFMGPRIDNVMMRFVDILYSLPFIFFVIILMVFFGREFILIFVAIGCVEWLDMARIVRGQTLSIKGREFIEAAEASGVSKFSIILRHIIPNTLGPVIVYMTLTVPRVIMLESFLSFLGLGVQEPYTSWGVLISEGTENMNIAPWLLLFPAGFLTVTLFSLNFLGDGLRDALDPRDR